MKIKLQMILMIFELLFLALTSVETPKLWEKVHSDNLKIIHNLY